MLVLGSERSCLPRGNASSCSSVSIVNQRIPLRIHLSVPRLDIALGWSMVKSQSWSEPLRATIQIIPRDTYPPSESTGPCQ